MKKGFTLIELLVVVAIIGMLSSVVLSALNTARAEARNASRLQAMGQVLTALELYANDNNGVYPSVGGNNYGCGSNTCLIVTQDELVPNYIPAIPLDPINGNTTNGYRYCRPTNTGDEYTILIRRETSSGGQDWCQVQHGANITLSGTSCWTTNGVPDHGWCHDEM